MKPVAFAVLVVIGSASLARGAPNRTAEASATAEGFRPAGAVDGDRFATEPNHGWQGQAGEKSWWWQCRFDRPTVVGAVLQIHGDHPTILRNAPRDYRWQISADGKAWEDLPETVVREERRLFRLHRFHHARTTQWLRLHISSCRGNRPTLREVEFFESPAAAVAFPDWAVVVSTTGDDKLPVPGCHFLPLARSCPGWTHLQGQEVWLGDFSEGFVAAEPRPICAFLSGNFIDWCQQKREDWQGVQEVLQNRNLPMWAACGGAQGLAILAETGIDKPWACPHCRDPKDPKLPIYTHIGHTAARACGDYSCCVFERGPTNVLLTADDPVFAGLPREFPIVESHCGQIEWPPKGWVLIATRGTGGKTKTQCLRVRDRYIYAAQFHIELPGAEANARKVMTNFLTLAKQWGGYNPQGKPPAPPRPF